MGSHQDVLSSRAGRFFMGVTARPKLVLALSLIVILGAGSMVPNIRKDTSSEAFMPEDHPAVVYRERVRDIFGLDDPFVIAVVRDEEHGVFNPKTLNLVQWLTDEVSNIRAVDPDRIMSIATENDISGTADGMEIEPFFDAVPESQKEADEVRDKVLGFPLYVGSIAAEDGTATLIIAEILRSERRRGDKTYREFEQLVARAPVENGEKLHIAGEGAVTQYMGTYIDRDAARMNPVSALVITLILVVAYRTLRGVVIPNLVVLGAAATTVGAMAAAGVPFYIITNALPVIIIAISVADAIHILSQYYEELAVTPEAPQRELVVRSMVHMWRPVTYTSLTDMAGFAGLGIASFMPPMRSFGFFACVGVAAALFFSVFMVPAALTLVSPKQSSRFRNFAANRTKGGDAFSRLMAKLGMWVINRPRATVAIALALSVAGIFGAMRLEVNEDRLSVFDEGEPIVLADDAISTRLDGTSYLDIVVETDEPEGLFNPGHLARIEKMQDYVESFEVVKGTTSIVDYLKQMHYAMNENQASFYALPDDPELIAQYFFLYSATGDPTDFEEEVDYEYRLANIRATLDSGRFTDIKPVVLGAQGYIAEVFDAEGITANLAGRINVDYYWIKDLARNHYMGVALAFLGVFLMASVSFRSPVAGMMATMPVAMSVLAIYAFMGWYGIWLGVGTSMFAAICIGVSVDFSIHTVDRIIALVRGQGKTLDEALALLYPSTGRALFFSFAALFCGFGVLCISEVVPLRQFAYLVGVAVTISFVSSLTVLPALLKLTNPSFLQRREESRLVEAAAEPQMDAVQ